MFNNESSKNCIHYIYFFLKLLSQEPILSSTQLFLPNDLFLDFDIKTKECQIKVDNSLSHKLKPHQRDGIKFMWNSCYESVERIKQGDKGIIQ